MKKPVDVLKVCEQALNHFGMENQIIKTIEECSELIHALSKLYTHVYGRETNHYNEDLTIRVLEELADVRIMVTQLVLVYGIDECEQVFQSKIIKLRKRLMSSPS